MAKKKEALELITHLQNKYQIRPWQEELFGITVKPITDEQLKSIGDQLITLIENEPKVRTIEKFLALKKIHPSTWKQWIKDREVAQKYHEYALMLLGIKREDAGLEGELNPQMISYVMPHYSEVWRAETERRSSLKASESKENKNMAINIIVEALPPLEKDDANNEGQAG